MAPSVESEKKVETTNTRFRAAQTCCQRQHHSRQASACSIPPIVHPHGSHSVGGAVFSSGKPLAMQAVADSSSVARTGSAAPASLCGRSPPLQTPTPPFASSATTASTAALMPGCCRSSRWRRPLCRPAAAALAVVRLRCCVPCRRRPAAVPDMQYFPLLSDCYS